jgi:hypothetical protein
LLGFGLHFAPRPKLGCRSCPGAGGLGYPDIQNTDNNHQDLHAPTMGVTISAIDNLTLKSMVQTMNNILIAYVRGRNLSHARMRSTYTLRERVIHHMS